MLKNKNLLKGITALVAFVLVLGVGVLLHTVAASDNLILYVSTYGDNTNGKDEATAFKTLKDATLALRDMKLSPSTNVTLVVVDKCYTTEGNTDAGQEMDGVRVYDSEGNKKLITITSLNTDNAANRSEIHLNYTPNPYHIDNQNVRVVNDLVFKDINIVSEVASTQVGSGDTLQYWAQKRMFLQNSNVTFDGVDFTFSDTGKCQSFEFIYTDFYHPVTTDKNNNDATFKGDLEVSFINCNLGNALVTRSKPIPGANLKYNFVNTTLGEFRGTMANCGGIEVYAEGTTFNSFFVLTGNNKGRVISGPVKGVLKNCVNMTNVFVTAGTMENDVTFEYIGGDCSGNFMVTRAGYATSVAGKTTVNVRESLLRGVFSGPQGNFNGVDVLIENSTGNRSFSASYFNADSATTINGDYNIVFDGAKYPVVAGDSGYFHGISGVTVTGDYNITIKGDSFIDDRFFGTKNTATTTTFLPVVVEGRMNVTMLDGRIDNYFGFGGGVVPTTIKGGLYNYFYGGDFSKGVGWAISGGSYGTNKYTPIINADITNVLQNGPDGKGEGPLFGGSCNSSARGVFSGGCQFDAKHTGNVTNYFYGARFINPVGGVAAGGHNPQLEGNITTYIGKGFSCPKWFYGGSVCGSVSGDVAVYAEDCSFDGIFYVAQAGSTINGNVSFEMNEGTNLKGGLYGMAAGYVVGNFYNTFNGGAIQGTASSNSYILGTGNGITGNVYNTFNGGTFNTNMNLSHSTPITGNVYNEYNGGTFTYAVYNASIQPAGIVKGNIYNTVNGGTFSKSFNGGGYRGAVEGDIVNVFNNTTMNTTAYGGHGSASSTHVGNIYNTINNTVFKSHFVAAHGALNASYTSKVNADTKVYGASFGNTLQTGTAKTSYLLLSPMHGDITLQKSNCIYNFATANITVTGGEHFLKMNSDGKLNAGIFEGTAPLKVSQMQSWTNGHEYVILPATAPANAFIAFADSASVTGTATQVNGASAVKLVGGQGNSAVIPTLDGYRISVDKDLSVIFEVDKTELANFINAGYTWSCTVKIKDQQKTLTFEKASDLDSFTGENVVLALTGILANDYDEYITISIPGRADVSTTVFTLLGNAVKASASDPDLQYFLKALHNYGIQTERYFDGVNWTGAYAGDISYSGSYNDVPVLNETAGYSFYGSSLAMDQKVALNLYLKAPSAEGLTAKVFIVGTEYAAAELVTKSISGSDSFNFGVSLSVPFTDMDEIFTICIYNGTTEVASYTGSVASVCNAYVEADADCKALAEGILALIEAASAHF